MKNSTTPTALPNPSPGAMRVLLPRLALSLVVAGGFVWLLRRGGLPIWPDSRALAATATWALPAYVLLALASTFFRTHRWVHLLRPLGPTSSWRVFGVGLVGSSATFFAPLRSGEIVRPYLLSRNGSFSFFQATGTVLAERIVDGLFVTSMTAGALLISTPRSPLPSRLGELSLPVAAVQAGVYGMCVAFLALFVVLVAFYSARDFTARLVQKLLGPLSHRAADFVSGTLQRLAEGLGFLAARGHRGWFVLETALYWTLGAIAQYALLRGSGLPVSMAEACVILGVMALGIIVPAGPGVFGAYQISTYTALALYRSEQEVLTAGSAFVFLSYVAIVALNSVGIALGFLILSRHKAQQAAVAADVRDAATAERI